MEGTTKGIHYEHASLKLYSCKSVQKFANYKTPNVYELMKPAEIMQRCVSKVFQASMQNQFARGKL